MLIPQLSLVNLSFFLDNLMNEAMISTWIKDEFESNKDVIEDLSAAQVAHVLENEQFVMVYVCK